MEPTKRCITCGKDKRTTEFYWRRRCYPKAGVVRSLMSSCKECTRQKAAHRYRLRRVPAPAGQKWCGRCKAFKPTNTFGPNAARPDGLQSYCRECLKPYQRAAEVQHRREFGLRPVTRKARDQTTVSRVVRRKAREYVRLAIFFGDLVPKDCEICGKPSEHAHHTDYWRPLTVAWLCRACHSKVHGGKFVGNKIRRRRHFPSPKETADEDDRP
mgnify:FL=1